MFPWCRGISPSSDCSHVPPQTRFIFLKGHIVQALCWNNFPSGRSPLEQDSFSNSPMLTAPSKILHQVPNHLVASRVNGEESSYSQQSSNSGSFCLAIYGRKPSDFSGVYQTFVSRAHLQLQGAYISMPSGLLTKLSPYTWGEGITTPHLSFWKMGFSKEQIDPKTICHKFFFQIYSWLFNALKLVIFLNGILVYHLMLEFHSHCIVVLLLKCF